MPKDFKPRMGGGDKGRTDLLGGRRVPKTDPRVKLNALLDELGALLGLLRSGVRAAGLKKDLLSVQKGLLAVSGVIAGAKTDLGPEVRNLEALIAAAARETKPPRKFVLPGETETGALAHYARAKARICEILAWELKAEGPAVCLNRLSDYLFLAALKCSRK